MRAGAHGARRAAGPGRRGAGGDRRRTGGGDEVFLFFRPEKCRLATHPRPGENRFRAEALSAEYLGDAAQVEVRAGGRGAGRRLLVRTPAPPARGEILEIAVDAADCWLLPAPAGAARA